MAGFKITDWDDAYTNGANIPNGNQWPEAWVAPAAGYRASAEARGALDSDVAYGSHPRCRYDLFHPNIEAKGLFVFVHGGYWLALDKNYWSHLAQGAVDSGWAVSIPSYALCPEVEIGQITQMIADAIAHAAGKVAGPIVICGHSAGGHLVASMLDQHTSLPKEIQSRIVNTVSVSGVHDLRPLLHTKMNDKLKLNSNSAATLSPALMVPVQSSRFTAWVGAGERSEFIRQSQLLSNIWRGLGVWTQCVVEPDQHHFSVIDALMDKNSPLVEAALDF